MHGERQGTASNPSSEDALHVHYVTMQFPAPSETFASQEVRILREKGLELVVHCLRAAHARADDMLRERGLDGLRVTHNGAWPTLRGAWRMMRRPGFAARMVAWVVRRTWPRLEVMARSLLLMPRAFDVLSALARAEPHVVHLYWGHYPAIVGRLTQARLGEAAVSISLNAYDLKMEYGPSADVAREADFVRTHASVNVEHVARFARIPPERVNVIVNGVDLPRIDAWREGVARVPRRVVTVGRVVEEKGVFEVMRAFLRVHERWPDATMAVLGEGPDLPRLRRMVIEEGVADAVVLHGHVEHRRVIRALAQAEVAVLLSHTERLPNVVKEAMATGCISVTTHTEGLEELLHDGRHGLVVPMHDPEAAATAIARVFRGEVDAEVLRDRARRHIEQHFDVHANVRRYASAWRSALARRQAPSQAVAPAPAREARRANDTR